MPPYGAVMGGEAATIEYAVSLLSVKDIVICGHSHCGAMAGLLDQESIAKMPAIMSYLGHAEATRRIVEQNDALMSDPQKRLATTVEENVLVQLENLRTHPAVAAAIGCNDLKLHGWVYKYETGDVFAFDPDKGQFLRVSDAERP